MTEKRREIIYEALTNGDYDQEVMQVFMGHGISLKNLGLIQAYYQVKNIRNTSKQSVPTSRGY